MRDFLERFSSFINYSLGMNFKNFFKGRFHSRDFVVGQLFGALAVVALEPQAAATRVTTAADTKSPQRARVGGAMAILLDVMIPR